MESKFIKNPKYLTLEFSGIYDHMKAMSSLDKSSTICKDEKCSRILIDFLKVDLATLTPMNRFDLGEKVAQIFAYPNFAKIAGVVKVEYYTKFTENVPLNRGVIGKILNNREKAIEWLLQ